MHACIIYTVVSFFYGFVTFVFESNKYFFSGFETIPVELVLENLKETGFDFENLRPN